LEKESYEKHFKENIPVFDKAVHKTFEDVEIKDIKQFDTFIVEDSWHISKNNKILNILKKILCNKSKTLIMTFQDKRDAKELGLNLEHIKNLKNYNERRSTPIDLYKLKIEINNEKI